jgi:hypothetical protein
LFLKGCKGKHDSHSKHIPTLFFDTKFPNSTWPNPSEIYL